MGPEPVLGTGASVCCNQLRAIQLRQSLVEAPDAGVVEVSWLTQPHDDGTSMVLQRQSRRIFLSIGREVEENRHREDRRTNNFR